MRWSLGCSALQYDQNGQVGALPIDELVRCQRMQRAIFCVLLLLCACGDKAKVPSAPPMRDRDSGMEPYDRDGGSGRGGRGGVGGAGGSGGMNGGAGAPDPLAPSLTFLSPTPTS